MPWPFYNHFCHVCSHTDPGHEIGTPGSPVAHWFFLDYRRDPGCNQVMKTPLLLAALLLAFPLPAHGGNDLDQIRRAVTFYASFDEAVQGDFGGGAVTLSTRFNHPTEKGSFIFKKGFPAKVFRIAPGKGIHGGALEVTDVLPDNGRIFFPAKGNIAFKKGGWSGSVSVWINTDPNKLLKTPFCDPIQITQKGANNGGIWFDFNNARPRDLRMGTFPAVAEGEKPISEADPKAPMVRVPAIGFKAGDWHHVVLAWTNFDTGKANAQAVLYIDGKRIGAITNAPIAMRWKLEKAGIYVAVNFIGLLDELALFNRMLTPEEISRLHRTPGLLAKLKKSS
jgi:hypothetical protein